MRIYCEVDRKSMYVDSGPNGSMVFKPRVCDVNHKPGKFRMINPKPMFYEGVTHYRERLRKLNYLSHISYENGVPAKALKSLNRLSMMAYTMSYKCFRGLTQKIIGLIEPTATKLAARPRRMNNRPRGKPFFTERVVLTVGKQQIKEWRFPNHHEVQVETG